MRMKENARPKKPRGWSILMADGNLDDHNFVKRAARDCGINHVFTSVYNGRQLLDLLTRQQPYLTDHNEKPDLLIMDIDLDLVSGWEILEWIKKNEPEKFPVYVLTQTRVEEDALKARHFGVREYFSKPLSYESWRKMIGDICHESFKDQFEKKVQSAR
jgi:CheY-like chemotaxis protein